MRVQGFYSSRTEGESVDNEVSDEGTNLFDGPSVGSYRVKTECGMKHSRHILIRNLMVILEVSSGQVIDVRLLTIGPSSIGIDVNFLNFENVYGIPEHADAFALRSTQYERSSYRSIDQTTRLSSDTDPYRLFNLDVFEYDIQNPMALYGAVPYMLAHK